jgi:hypothetical protein
MTDYDWHWKEVNGLKYLWDPISGALYDTINLFPSGYLYQDGTWTFRKQPPSLTSTMKDPAIQEYMKNPKKMKSGMDWGTYWQKRKAAEAANPIETKSESKKKLEKKSKDSIKSLTKKMNTMNVAPTIHI